MPRKKQKLQPIVVKRQASRQHIASQKSTALAEPLERRLIVLAQGLQFDNTMLKQDWRVPDYLKKKLGSDLKIVDPKSLGPGKQLAYYLSPDQGVRFTIKVTMDKDEFKEALQTIDTHVIYAGHARYGRGPCFGFMPNATYNEFKQRNVRVYKGENWGDGEQPNKTGLFRMAFPYVPVPVSELLHYFYTPKLVESDKGRPAKAMCHPDIQANYRKLQTYSIADLALALERQWKWEYQLAHKDMDKNQDWSTAMDHVSEREPQLFDDPDYPRQRSLEIGSDRSAYRAALERCIGVPCEIDVPSERRVRFWGYDAYVNGFCKRFVIHEAGWQNTASFPWEVGRTDMKCRSFCHFGCSTLKHNRRIIRGKKYKDWRQEIDDHYAFFTDATSYMMAASRWIYHLLTYPKYNALMSWKGSLKYALEETNRDLKDMKQKFRIRSDPPFATLEW